MKAAQVRIGSLYEVNGVVCRAVNRENKNTFLMSYHKRFLTYATSREIRKTSKSKIKAYLNE